MDYLVFRLYGPMASWGEPAVGEARPSATYPGRSAVVGLLAAALGIERSDEGALARLRDSVLVAVRQTSAGTLMRDYHTAQVPGRDRRSRWRTRRDELAVPKQRLHTILSAREYRCDGYWDVAVRLTEASAWGLSALAEALRRPRFHLYLGRKSCPLAAPLVPRVVTADGVREALAQSGGPLTEYGPDEDARRLAVSGGPAYAWEGDGGDLRIQETRHPTDQPLNRRRWQFTTRPEHWHQAGEES